MGKNNAAANKFTDNGPDGVMPHHSSSVEEVDDEKLASKASSNGWSSAVNGAVIQAVAGLRSTSRSRRGAYEAAKTYELAKRLVERVLMPVFLMLTTPNAVILVWFSAVHCEGSYACVGEIFLQQGLRGGLSHVWSHVNWPSWPIVGVILGYCLWALALMRLVPGPTVYGPLTPKGNRPMYRDNGFSCFLITMLAFAVLTVVSKTMWGVSPTIIYDRFDEVLLFLTLFSAVFCLLLVVKGRVAPSTSDSGSSGNAIFDYYWGMELYPRILGFDVKVFTNCRFGMTVWALLVAIFALKSYELHGPVDSMLVSAALQMVYFLKFFWWESGYMCTIDIMVDRAGYYICWGCMVYITGFYTSVSLFLVRHPVALGLPLSLLILVLGAGAVYWNYDADRQKLTVRATDGKCLVWGRKPVVIRAKYRLDSGREKTSLLLASGWWGLSRHFHYVPEILLAFFWSVPALFGHVMPYSYVLYLTLLLIHRSYRDETKCSAKYRRYWDQYKKIVPYKIIPYLF